MLRTRAVLDIEMHMMVTSNRTAEFHCPNCNALYKVVRLESKSTEGNRQITCRSCGAPLQGREATFNLKYFLVRSPPDIKQRRFKTARHIRL
jgi:transcription elongation factor Elf1